MAQTLSSQQKKALLVDRNIALTANAGSGKTFILSKRFLETVVSKSISVNQIAAITFTEKAANELLAKISNDIDEFLLSGIPEKLRLKIQKFRELILTAKISTIHSFCSDILKKYPIEAEIDTQFSIIEDSEKNELIASAVDKAVRDLLNKNLVKDVLRIFGKQHLFEKLERMINKRYLTEKVLDNLYSYDFGHFDSKIDELYIKYFASESSNKRIQNLVGQLKKVVPFMTDSMSADLSDLVARVEKKFEVHNFREAFLLLSRINQIVFVKNWDGIRKKSFIKGKIDCTEFENIIEQLIIEVDYFSPFFNEEYYDENYEKQRFLLTKVIIEIYNSAIQKYESEKNKLGFLDYDDLLIKTDQLLNNELVKKEISKSLKYILVDEFQDTDQLQYSILKKITNDFDEEHFLFIVGDEKQSIYGFRNADIKVFQNAKSEISNSNSLIEEFDFYDEKIGLMKSETSGIITLPENYRLLPNLIAFNNYIFKSFMKENIDLSAVNFDGEVSYSELVHARNNNANGVVELIISDNTIEDEVEKLADKIEWLVNSGYKIFKKYENANSEREHPVDYRDIGILFREKSFFKKFEREFAKRKIPYTITGGKGYYQTEEITDWIQYFKFLSDSKNDVALAAVLRSPFYSLSDNELFELCENQNGESLFEKFFVHVKGPNNREVFKVYDLLNRHLSFAGRTTIPNLIQFILKDTGYSGVIASEQRGNQISANVLKLLDNAREFEAKGFSDLYDFSEYLKFNWKEDTEVSEAPVNEMSNSVKLLTIHQAKGLEFPIVILPKSDVQIKNYKLNYGQLDVEENTGFIFKINSENENVHTKSSVLGYHIKSQNNYNEALRVFYVALTRARDYLIISGTGHDKLFSQESLLKKILEILEVDDFRAKTRITRSARLSSIIMTEKKSELREKDFQLEVELNPNFGKGEKGNKSIADKQAYSVREIAISPLTDVPKGEFFTATQLNTFSLCPTKYLIKYQIGFDRNFSKAGVALDSTEDSKLAGPRFGNLIHKIMEEITSHQITESELIKLIDKSLLEYQEFSVKEVRSELISTLNEIVNSETFRTIFSKSNFLVEQEINSKFGGQFLRGIIDRIIIEKNKITIVDFKTDTFTPQDYETKVSEYLTQMGFYSVLVKNYFRMDKNIELILFFVRHPENVFRKVYTTNDMIEYEKIFSNYIDRIVSRNFEKNLSHCQICEYYINNDCLI